MDEFDRAWLTDMLDHAELAVELLGARDADALEGDVRTLFESAMPFRRSVKPLLMCRDGVRLRFQKSPGRMSLECGIASFTVTVPGARS